MQLVDFDDIHASVVLGWADSDVVLAHWASLDRRPDASIFRRWHEDPDTHAFVLRDDEPLGYGELWVSDAEDEVELGRILVAPDSRGRGIGRVLVRLLIDEARTHGQATAWVRIANDNERALRCYTAVGFVRVPEELERDLNRSQPRGYRWLRLALTDATGSPASGDRLGAP